MSLGDFAKETVEHLIPPEGDEKILSPKWRRYHLTVSATLVGVTIMTGLHIAWACGLLASFGFAGFANASDVTQQQATLNSIQTRQITGDIRDAKRQICMAQQSRNSAALYSWSNTLEQARGQYYAITHIWPQVQSCDELVIAGPNGPTANGP